MTAWGPVKAASPAAVINVLEEFIEAFIFSILHARAVFLSAAFNKVIKKGVIGWGKR